MADITQNKEDDSASVIGPTEEKKMEAAGATQPLSYLSEDWVAVVIGGILISIILFISRFIPGFGFKLPTYQWADLNDLQEKVLSAANLSVIALIGLVLFVLAPQGSYYWEEGLGNLRLAFG